MSNKQSRVVRLALSYGDTTLTKWAIERGFNPHSAQAALSNNKNSQGEVGSMIRTAFIEDFTANIKVAEDGLISLMPADYAEFFRREGLEAWAWKHGWNGDEVYAAVRAGRGEIFEKVKEAMQYV